jgi:hypothetical protein
MKRIFLLVIFLLFASGAYTQDIRTKNTVPVPSNGAAGGINPSVWSAHCKDGMVMTGIEIVVGGTCHHQCDGDGRPLAAYRILCSQLEAGKVVRLQDSQTVVAAPLVP